VLRGRIKCRAETRWWSPGPQREAAGCCWRRWKPDTLLAAIERRQPRSRQQASPAPEHRSLGAGSELAPQQPLPAKVSGCLQWSV